MSDTSKMVERMAAAMHAKEFELQEQFLLCVVGPINTPVSMFFMEMARVALAIMMEHDKTSLTGSEQLIIMNDGAAGK